MDRKVLLTKLNSTAEIDDFGPINPKDLARALWSFSTCLVDREKLCPSNNDLYSVNFRLALEGIDLAASYINQFTAEELVSRIPLKFAGIFSNNVS